MVDLWPVSFFDPKVIRGRLGENGDTGIKITHDVLKEAPEPEMLWADNVAYGSFKPYEYDPKGEIQVEIDMADYPKDYSIFIDMSQDDFITLVRSLNRMKNTILKLRRDYDEQHHKVDQKRDHVQRHEQAAEAAVAGFAQGAQKRTRKGKKK